MKKINTHFHLPAAKNEIFSILPSKFFFMLRNRLFPYLTWSLHNSFSNFVECKFIWTLFVKYYVVDGHSEMEEKIFSPFAPQHFANISKVQLILHSNARNFLNSIICIERAFIYSIIIHIVLLYIFLKYSWIR